MKTLALVTSSRCVSIKDLLEDKNNQSNVKKKFLCNIISRIILFDKLLQKTTFCRYIVDYSVIIFNIQAVNNKYKYFLISYESSYHFIILSIF